MNLPQAINQLAKRSSAAVGLHDRGQIVPGLRADLNVINYDELSLEQPSVLYDLPGGGRRLTQRASGIEATIVAGEITYRNGVPTGALPGRLVRGS
jgi:N-acyl-D-aspartate/D-glutamate deacylase